MRFFHLYCAFYCNDWIAVCHIHSEVPLLWARFFHSLVDKAFYFRFLEKSMDRFLLNLEWLVHIALLLLQCIIFSPAKTQKDETLSHRWTILKVGSLTLSNCWPFQMESSLKNHHLSVMNNIKCREFCCLFCCLLPWKDLSYFLSFRENEICLFSIINHFQSTVS